MKDLVKNFDPISVSGTLLIKGSDGSTCEVDIHEIMLDRSVPDRWKFDVIHTPQYVAAGFIQKCVANPVTGLGVKIAVDSWTREKLFTVTFRPAEEAS